ncbi:MAG: hypothetical protein CVV45_16650 [Spirochaetae bacterium HGW-Spirochaetae-10]|nr:MAG: hypothetical protein CVV45_16650 [Spirochaetae bacterium HGW-Spirochaetae-10]
MLRRLLLFSLFLTVGVQAEVLEKSIDFSVSHPLHEVKGTVDRIEIRNLQTSDGRSIRGPFQIEIPYTALNTGNGNRDSHLLEILGYPEHRSILVEILEVKPVDEAHVSLHGYLTIGGVRRPAMIPASLTVSSGVSTVEGTTAISLKEFQIEAPSLLGMAVADLVTVHFRFLIRPDAK